MKNIFVLGLLLISFQTLAKDGSSGCGPGWYVAKDNSLLSSALRATTNGFLLPTSTLGMTFGTSNCTKHKIVKREKESLKFITENYFEVAMDLSKGHGEYLTAYGELMGCGKSELNDFSIGMKKQFKKVYPDMAVNPERVVKQTYIYMLNSKQLRKACLEV